MPFLASAQSLHSGDHFATRAAAAAPSTTTACRAVPRTADQEREAPVLARYAYVATHLLTSALLALPARAHSPHAGGHFSTRAQPAAPTTVNAGRAVPRAVDQEAEGSASARARHRRRHFSSRERTPCPSSKCALPARRRPPRHACKQRQQRLHQQPPLPVALCFAQPTKSGPHQCSQ